MEREGDVFLKNKKKNDPPSPFLSPLSAPEQLAPAPPSANRTGGPYGDDGGLNFWCGIASCIKDASPGSPACQAAHKLIKPTVRKFKLTYEWGKFDPDGAGLKDVILVNGQYPGPTLEGEWERGRGGGRGGGRRRVGYIK